MRYSLFYRFRDTTNDFQEALKEAELLGYKDQRLALTLYDLGHSYAAQKRYSEAEPPLKRSLDIRENLLGREHLDVAQSLYMLGMVYVVQGKFEEAQPLLRDSLAIKEKALGPEHPEVADNLFTLAMDLLPQRKFREAEPLLNRSLTITEKVLGPEHPSVTKILGMLALVQRNTNRAAEAQATEAHARSIQATESSAAAAQPFPVPGLAPEDQTGKASTAARPPSLAEVARQARALKEQRAQQEKSIDVYEGRLTLKATPKFEDTQNRLINQMEIFVRNSSRRNYRYVFTAKCGDWSKKLSANIKGSSDGTTQASILVDVPATCDWSTAVLSDFREAEGLDGPEARPSKVPGIDDAELARQSAVQRQRIVETYSPADSVSAAKATGAAAGQPSIDDSQVEILGLSCEALGRTVLRAVDPKLDIDFPGRGDWENDLCRDREQWKTQYDRYVAHKGTPIEAHERNLAADAYQLLQTRSWEGPALARRFINGEK